MKYFFKRDSEIILFLTDELFDPLLNGVCEPLFKGVFGYWILKEFPVELKSLEALSLVLILKLDWELKALFLPTLLIFNLNFYEYIKHF
jgi:hypothetical protein